MHVHLVKLETRKLHHCAALLTNTQNTSKSSPGHRQTILHSQTAYLDAVGAVVGGEEGVDKEYLRDGVGEVDQLGDDVECQQVAGVLL